MLNRGRNIEKGRVITRRMFILAAAKVLLFAGISSRLYNLQISDREKYEILSDKNRIRVVSYTHLTLPTNREV